MHESAMQVSSPCPSQFCVHDRHGPPALPGDLLRSGHEPGSGYERSGSHFGMQPEQPNAPAKQNVTMNSFNKDMVFIGHFFPGVRR
jgi:hypothetical protein